METSCEPAMSVKTSVREYVDYQAELYAQVVYLKVALVDQEQTTEKLKAKNAELRLENNQLQAQLRANGHTSFSWVT